MANEIDKDKETAERRDAALRRALTTPPKPKQESVKRKEKPSSKKAETPASKS